jgi:PAS domain S-box-containing protein
LKLIPNSILNTGVKKAGVDQKKNVQITNFLAVALIASISAILTFRYLTGAIPLWFYVPLAGEVAAFIFIIYLNRLGYWELARLLICWVPPIILFVDFRVLISHVTPETSHYLGFRLFQISFSFFPFLVYSLAERKKISIALSVPLICTIFYDYALNFMSVGYGQAGLTDTSYYYNNFRTVVSLSILAGAFVYLKSILEKQERELALKNQIIEKNAKRELKKAYGKLSYHINNTPLAVIERDKDFKITFWNKRAEELYGWKAEEVLGLRPQDFLVDPRDLAFATKAMTGAIESKKDAHLMEVRGVAKDGTTRNCIWYYSFLRDEEQQIETVLSFISDITEQRRANYALNERVKELRTLYNVSQILTNAKMTMHEVFGQLPSILKSGWQYPEVCEVRLIAFDTIYQTEAFCESTIGLSSNIENGDRTIGKIDVVYLENVLPQNEAVFLQEEKDLLVAIAQTLKVYIERRLEEDLSHKTRANLEATINNTEIMVWSVDANFKITTYNEAARLFAKNVLNVRVDAGEDFPEAIALKWRNWYQRVLTGEVVEIEEITYGREFKYSLSPIIENANIIGVTVFADNVTDHNLQQRALSEANRKIGELKAMALQSVMNPHFIFNVLSSIQYFITRNDELNAINYLTTFSKLMRNVLSRSVAKSVTIGEELDLLRDYVHLEKLRFENRFDFIIDHKEIDIDELRIPSLLIQPYVENAILHGLYNKEGNGLLKLVVRDESPYIIFDIEDNGIGRERAKELQSTNPLKKKSMGTTLTEERLAIYNNDQQPPVIFTDLYKDGNPEGTKVTIHIRKNPEYA